MNTQAAATDMIIGALLRWPSAAVTGVTVIGVLARYAG
jgi:hypothetical protein